MLLFDGFAGLVVLGLWIFCLIDVVTTAEDECRNLPKVLWLLIVLFLFDMGSIAWLIAGRNWNRIPGKLPYQGNGGRPAPARRATNPDDDEEFQAQLRALVDEQRRRARDPRPGDDAAPPA